MNTLPEANVAPEKQWLENEISFWERLFLRGWAGLGNLLLLEDHLETLPLSWPKSP